MVNRYTLGTAILSVFLLAIFGIQGAFSWLRQSPRADNTDRIVAIEDGRTNGDIVDSVNTTGNRSNTRISGDNSELTNGDRNNIATFSPLEEAGTYIQRQKRVERDPIVAQTQVDVVPIASANNTPTPVQSDSRVIQPAPDRTAQTTTPSRPAAATTTTEAVPALW